MREITWRVKETIRIIRGFIQKTDKGRGGENWVLQNEEGVKPQPASLVHGMPKHKL